LSSALCTNIPPTEIPTMASAQESLARIKGRSEETDRILADLQGAIEAIKAAAVKEAGKGEEEKLIKENEELKKEVQSLKTALTLAEIGNGVRMVKLPTKGSLTACASLAASSEASAPETTKPSQEAKPAKSEGKKNKQEGKPEAGGKKAKTEGKGGDGKASKASSKAAADTTELPVDISRLDLRVGKIVGVEKHPDADSLYVEQVDLGEGKTRTIVSGLVKHVPINAMQDRVAVFFCNLKPAKMRGILSEGMIMCAVGPDKTEILVPPMDAEIGDKVTTVEYPGSPDGQLNPKKKIWETLKPDVRTNKDRVATFKGAPLIVVGKGDVVAPTLSDVQIS